MKYSTFDVVVGAGTVALAAARTPPDDEEEECHDADGEDGDGAVANILRIRHGQFKFYERGNDESCIENN